MRILIADDNQAEAEALKRLLKLRFDAEVLCVKTMRELRQVVAANNLDCIVLDLQMDDSKIDETISYIPGLPYPVFVYTGFDDPSLRERVLESGAEDFIVKITGNASIIERIGHLQYKLKPDKKLLEGAYAARHDEARRGRVSEWRGTVTRLIAAAATVISFATGTILGGWAMAKKSGVLDEEQRQHFSRLDTAIVELKDAGQKRDKLLDDLREKATRSVDDRQAMRDAFKDQNMMVVEWLKRIEAKVDARR